MLIIESMQMAFSALLANKLRSLLTMLGIIIGVAAVIIMISIGEGFSANMKEQFGDLGSNTLSISPSATNTGGIRGARGSRRTLKYADAEAIEKKVKNIQYISPTVNGSYQLVNGNLNTNAGVGGVKPDYISTQSLEVAKGAFISNADLEKRNRVVVLGKTVASDLFQGDDPVGQTIRINSQPYKVIGVLAAKGTFTMMGTIDEMAFVPITTAMERLMGVNYVQGITVKAVSPEDMTQVQSDIESLLRQRHHIFGTKEDDFAVENMTSIAEMQESFSTGITLFLGFIAGISLLVGGIGIMNIMMVSVTERTREIGIRKALGATYANIMLQFLIESVVLSVFGGLIGIVIACSVSTALPHVSEDIKSLITPTPIIISFLFSVGIGLFFGIYPARKAALLDPIDALRYE